MLLRSHTSSLTDPSSGPCLAQILRHQCRKEYPKLAPENKYIVLKNDLKSENKDVKLVEQTAKNIEINWKF